jgi:uncharacterized membrane protein
MLNLIISLLLSATIEGTVYDENLNKIPAVITIKKNDLMYSQLTTKDGDYKIQIPSGNYTFIVWNKEKNLTDIYKLNIENDTVFDFILLPSQYQPIDFPETVSIEEIKEEFPAMYEEKGEITSSLLIYGLVVIIVIIVIIIFLFYFYAKKKSEEITKKIKEEIEELKKREEKKEYLSDEEKVYQMIQEGKEVPQKEIVKKTGFSKAKVTLILEKLEKKGKIERLSVGREKIVRIKR